MTSNLLIFLRINWPQCVKSTVKFGGGLCLPGAELELPLIPRADRCAAARAQLMHLTSFSIHSRNSVFVHPHFESRHWPSIIIIICQIIQQYPPNPWKKIEQCTSTSIQFRRAGQQGPTRTLTAALKRLIQEAQLSPRDRAMRRVSWNLANCTQQQRNYLYDKSWTNRSHEVGGLRWADV